MFPRDNKGKDKLNKPVDTGRDNEPAAVTRETMSREDLFAQDKDAKKIFDEIRSLRESVETLKKDDMDVLPGASKSSAAQTGSGVNLEYTQEIKAAEQAIIKQAIKDAEAKKLEEERARRRDLENQQAKKEAMDAQRRAEMVREEAERKRMQAEEARRRANAISRKQALDAMEAELQKKNRQLEEYEAWTRSGVQRQDQTAPLNPDGKPAAAFASSAENTVTPAQSTASPAANTGYDTAEATPEEKRAFFGEAEVSQGSKPEPERDPMKGLEEARRELLEAQKKQGDVLGAISQITEMHTEKLAEEQQKKLSQQQMLLKAEQEKLQELLDEHKNERLAREERDRRAREIKAQKARVEKLIKEERAKAAREEKLARAKKKHEEKIHRAEAKERLKRAKREAAERARLEKERLKEKSIADAELGGGVVNVKGLQINTKIKDTLSVSFRDLLGFAGRKERKEASEEKTQEMREERERRREEAREAVEISMKQRYADYEKSPFGKKMRAFKNFCDVHKKPLLVMFSVFIMLIVGVAGVFNYCTAYEYSYNGRTLGLVKEKDDVLRITDLVQGALTKDKNVDVVIDPASDIEFKRVSALGNVEIDSSEEVLKRLSYMGNLNVKAYGIYINGEKVGSVENKKTAANVLQDIKDRYTSKREGAKIEEAVFIENVEAKQTNTELEDVISEKEMVERLCTSGEKETMHKVVAGDTLADIAKRYSVDEDDILADNPGVDKKKLEVGSTLLIRQNAPVLTVQITELVTYEKEIEHEVDKQEDADMYEGDTKTKQAGENGVSEITSRIVLINGEEKQETPLVTTVKKEPVTEIITVGTKERPPTVGSGKYIWPLSGGYTLTSNFGGRWGTTHEGIDLGVSVGTTVMAADGGTVTYSGYSGAYGYLVIIDHQNGMETRYAHNSELLVSVGDKVYQGQSIAKSGNTGRSTGPHVHFEIRVDGVAKDPLNYLP